jgi:hypothetical protein
MVNPVLTPAMTRLRTGFNVAYPSRSKQSDGWIGNEAHQQETSGHNPDDTPGVRAERSDPDSIPEVRGLDVDVDLVPGNRAASRQAMRDAIASIIATPADRRRLIYIIFDEVIWSASRAWRAAPYDGASDHREHAHFSGHPDYDNDATAWSVETGADVTPEELLGTFVDSPSLGGRTVSEWIKGGEAATRKAAEASSAASAANSSANSAASAASKAASEAELAKELAGQAGLAVSRVEGKVDELLARPPVAIDYRQLAGALLEQVREEAEEDPPS